MSRSEQPPQSYTSDYWTRITKTLDGTVHRRRRQARRSPFWARGAVSHAPTAVSDPDRRRLPGKARIRARKAKQRAERAAERAEWLAKQ